MTTAAPPQQAKQAESNVSREMALGLCALTLLALALYVIGVQFWPRAMLAAAVFTFVPGMAILSFLPRVRPLARTGLAAALSLTTIGLIAYPLVLLDTFYPILIIGTVLPLSCLALLLRAVRGVPSEPFIPAVRDRIDDMWEDVRYHAASQRVFIAVVLGVILWIVSASAVNWRDIADLGLVPLLPIPWKLAFFGVIVTIALYAVSESPRPWLVGFGVASLVAIIYLTPVIIYDAPHYPWNYKHVGVTELLLHEHEAFTFIDIYNRWPTFFAMAGTYTRFGGFSNTVQYVQWAEFYFISIQAMLVASLARTEDKSYGFAGLAAAMFVLIDWIGQAYFSPQATAFTLMLAVTLVIWTNLYDGGNKLGNLIAKIGGALVRTKQRWPERPEVTDWSTTIACLVVLFLVAAIAFVHQLSPYVLLMQMALITILGYMRPRWLFIAGAVITVAYLAPQFGWINENFGVLGSLDPFKNAGRERVIDITCNAACQKVTNSIMGATAFAALGACVAILVIGRRRPETRLPLLVLCFLAPFLTLLGQSYGGEAILRVVMFSAPFSGMLLALALMTFKRAWLKRVLAVGVMLVLGYGFLYAYFGIEEDRYVTPSDVKANQYLYAHAPESSLAVPLAPNVPGQLSYNYWQVYSPYAGIFINPKILKQPYTDHMVDDLAEWVGEQTDDAFVIFNPEMETIAENVGVMLPGVSEKLEKAMVESGRFTLWHQDGDTKIYRLVPRPGPN